MAFSFRLEPVRRIRSHRERDQQQLFAKRLREHSERENIRRKLQKKLHEAGKTKLDGRLSVSDFKHRIAYHEELQQQLREAEKAVDQAWKRVEEQRKALLEATRKRKMLDKLHDKKLQQFREESEAAEQKELNEMSVQRYQRQQLR